MTQGSEMSGYTYGTREVARSPVSLRDLALLRETLFFTEEDERYLRLAGDVLADQLDEVLDAWFRATPILYSYFMDPEGRLDRRYIAAVKRRSGQWILDTCRRPYDQSWLDYTHEVGLRHHRSKKNRTDQVAAVSHVPLRYVIAFIYHTTEMIRPFLARNGHAAEDVRRMHAAWCKSVILQVALWSRVYAADGDW